MRISLTGSQPQYFIWHSDYCASLYSLIIKAKRCTISQVYFGKELYIFGTVSLSEKCVVFLPK